MIRIHKEGYKTITVIFITLVLALAIINFFLPQQTVFHYLIYLASLIFFLFIVRFFRNPQRPLTINNSVITAPADGKIVVIEETEEKVYFHDKRIQISIFMSPMDIHKNWYPISGKILFYKYHPGRFMVAWHPKSSELNERTTTVVGSEKFGPVLVRQIAGAVAQRIICYARENVEVNQGEELGFIKFGSRVDVFLPPGTKILVAKDQKVTGNVTVLATL
jgi:phosphatidylserine decarboxylase